MRNRFLIFFGLITLLLLQGCASHATNIGNSTFQSSDKTYTVKMRPGWEVITSLKGNFSMTINNGRTLLLGNTARNVAVSDGKLIELADNLNTRYAREMGNGTVSQSEMLRTKNDNLRYVRGTGEGKTNAGTPVLFTTYIIAGNKNLYVFFITGQEESYIKEQDIIRKIPDNFREL